MKYAALLRGISPSNPNMRNEKLCGVFEELGFKNVKAVISSGNVLFESSSKNIAKLEDKIEKSFPKKLGFSSTTIIRNKEELEKLIEKNPFGQMEHNQKNSLNVTFLKKKSKSKISFPLKGKGYEIVKVFDREICFVINLSLGTTPAAMRLLEKELGKGITTRTWKTVLRLNSLL